MPATTQLYRMVCCCNKVIDKKINYIHNNPVEGGLVFRSEDNIYSNAKDYSGEKGILNNNYCY